MQFRRTDDLHISPLREDAKRYGTPTWIWSVVVDGTLYLRAYNGKGSRWYKAALRQKAGRITAAGMTKEVIFERVDGHINDRIDGAYRAKYPERQDAKMNRMAVMIAALSLSSSTWAQGQHTENGRKSETHAENR